MDLHSQTSKNMEDIAQMFKSRMDHFDKSLAETQGSSKESSPSIYENLSALAADCSVFKDLMWKVISTLRQQMELLSTGFDKLEALSRGKIILFHGLAENNDEEIELKIGSVFSDKMKLSSFDPTNIDIYHQLGVKKDRPRPVLVRFTSRKYKNTVWNSNTALKGSGISVSEFLTKPRQEVFTAARKNFGIKSCWTSEGTVIVALPNKTRVKVPTLSDLQTLIDKHPVKSNTEEPKQKSRRDETKKKS